MHILFITLFFAFSANAAYNNILDVDFMQSMTDGNRFAREIMLENPKLTKTLQDQYEAKKPSKMLYNDQPLIPKVMHHVWDGDIPPLYQNYLNECKKLHPDWEFKFWSDKEVRALGLEYQDLYDKMRNYSGRSDIARYEILYRFGGVYRDLDVKCFRPIDDLNHKYEFYAPIEFPVLHWEQRLSVNNGIIGTKAAHPILKRTLEIIKEELDEAWIKFDQDQELERHSFMVAKTSMLPLTDAFLQKGQDKDIAMPTSYFFSLSRVKYNNLKQVFIDLISAGRAPRAFSFLEHESLMQHNFRKKEIYNVNFKDGNEINDPKIRRLFNKLAPSDRRIYKVFAHLYELLNPENISWSRTSKIPQIIHFVALSNEELSELNKNLATWKILNGDFEIKIWDKAAVTKEFSDISFEEVPDNLHFYIGLKILEKFGGSYAHYKTVPYRPIFELANKYNFYAALRPLTTKELSLSQKLVGASKMHPIISKTLQQVDIKSLDQLDRVFKEESYKNIYFYDEITGRNLILPAVAIFEEVALKETSIMDKFIRFVMRKPKAFSILSDAVIAG